MRPSCSLAGRLTEASSSGRDSAAALTRMRQACATSGAAVPAPLPLRVAAAGRGQSPIASSSGLISSASTTRPLSLSSARPRTSTGPLCRSAPAQLR